MADDTGTTDTTADSDTDDDTGSATDTGQQSGAAGQQKTAVPPEVAKALRAANKEAEKLRLELKAFQDRDKTDAEKLAERAAAAEKRAEETEARALRLEVAAEKGLTLRQAKRLSGATRKELEADADELLEDLADKGTGQAPAFNGGVRKTAEAPVSMSDRIRAATGRS